MKREEINKTVASAIADVLGCDINQVSQQTNLVEDLGADSLDAVEILMLTEEALDIQLPDDQYSEICQNMHTVKDVCDLAEKYVNK